MSMSLLTDKTLGVVHAIAVYSLGYKVVFSLELRAGEGLGQTQ